MLGLHAIYIQNICFHFGFNEKKNDAHSLFKCNKSLCAALFNRAENLMCLCVR